MLCTTECQESATARLPATVLTTTPNPPTAMFHHHFLFHEA